MKSLIWVSILILTGIGLTSTVMTQNAFAQMTEPPRDPSQTNTQIQSIFQKQKAVNNCGNLVVGGAFNTAACANTQNQGAAQGASASNTNDPRDPTSASNTNGDPNSQSNFQLQSISQKQWAANNCANTVVGGAFNTAACVNNQNQGALQLASASNTNDPSRAASTSNTNGDPNGQSNTQFQFLRQSQWAANNCANTVVGGLGNTAACVNNQNQLAVQLASASNQ